MNLPKPLVLIISIWGTAWAAFITIFISSLVVVFSLLGASQAFLLKIARSWGRLLLKGAFIGLSTKGFENLAQAGGYVFVSNHTSALDIPALQAGLPPNFHWLAKKELFKIAIFGPAIRRAGALPIDRSNNRAAVKSLVEAAKCIIEGDSAVIFPEGTRSEDGGLLPFKSGGLALAIRAQSPVVPVAIIGAARAMAPNKLLIAPGHIQVVLGEPISTAGMKMPQRDELAGILKERIQELIEKN
ncbi:lysophospholipid acyltransferase family protein [Dethiosulfatarculus sandiegensis]|uniref:1-acyl-sn-glycerol-3-phosphate acyltransferase n=1 Tax=Dethiosulfatarculus sandiegensis TaxID=1429043 RepID=A0A0D2K353_9BACT|nr:lysophospholipid acyltransferase family protein [Dethiosulfatarculus sandiegensis]KIX15990.1 1-acyl-sn-glycerol-3-phosphate acyltransferase [Dethiosulfatarculus sandiegensis]